MPHPSQTDLSSSDSETPDVPESISLSQSKKNIQKLDAERRNAEAARRRANKDKNREIDRKLKKRAATNKQSAGKDRSHPSGNVVQDELEMQEEDEEADSESAYESDGEEEFLGINLHEHDSDNDEDSDSDASATTSADDHGTATRHHQDHLPDELFAAAFRSSSKRKLIDDAPPKRPEKKRKSKKDKDIIVGYVTCCTLTYNRQHLSNNFHSRSRAIRILPDSSAPLVPSTTPSQKINQFLDRSLALTDAKQNLYTRGWERRPGKRISLHLSLVDGPCFSVNIGVLKRDGPPISFVRNR